MQVILYLQEHFLLIQEVEEQPVEGQEPQIPHGLGPQRTHKAAQPLQEEVRGVPEVNDPWQHEDGYRIHSHHNQRKRPLLPSLHVDDPVEQCEHGQ